MRRSSVGRHTAHNERATELSLKIYCDHYASDTDTTEIVYRCNALMYKYKCIIYMRRATVCGRMVINYIITRGGVLQQYSDEVFSEPWRQKNVVSNRYYNMRVWARKIVGELKTKR